MSILSRMKNMFTEKPKIIVVLGQTSTGKSDLAVDLPLKHNGEIISADSRQVYRGMNIGSGKITKTEMKGVPHHLLDVADPNDIFSVHDFQEKGTQILQNVLDRKKTPIICGGTGFYIDALVYQTQFSQVPANLKLRAKLEKKSLPELQQLLKEKMDTRFRLGGRNNNKIDMKNPVRIMRALEIIDALGYIPKIKKQNSYNVLWIGLSLPKDVLDKRIHTRIVKRLENGMLDEAHTLLSNGVSHDRLQSLGLEYRFMSKHILGEINFDEMIDQLYRATVQFAKRQKTWFKRNKNIHWFDSVNERDGVFEAVERFIK
ncbi:MAG: tRNA (adenosine(37)-N6)-dimethylallyltransferase MiaA [Minisyncoccia bacterium]